MFFAKIIMLALVSSSAVGVGYAQTVPDAGSISRDKVLAPIFPLKDSSIGLPSIPASDISTNSQASIPISGFRVAGATVFSNEVLEALLNDRGARIGTLRELQAAAGEITAYYRKHGYIASRAYVAPQQIVTGIVTISVLEGRLEEVQIENGSRLSDESANKFMAAIVPNKLLRKDATDRALLLISDTPGVGKVDSRFIAGSKNGNSVLVANLGVMPLLSGRVDMDNFGGLYTGRNRIGVSADLNSPLGYGERLSLRAMGSERELLYGRLAGQIQVGGDGWMLGAAMGRTTYTLGDAFAALDAVGHSSSSELFARYPLVRSTASNLYLQPSIEYRKLRDEVRSTSTLTEKRAVVAGVNLQGDVRDYWLEGGVTSGSLLVVQGRLYFDSHEAGALDAVGARTAGSYSKVGASIERQQYLGSKLTLIAQWRGQWADGNLDSSEKFTLGGPNGIRAYATSEAASDRGWLGSVELRYAFSPSIVGSVFHDHGEVSVNARPYLSTPNTLRRSGNGFGLTGSYGSFDWRASVAWRDGKAGTAEPDRLPRLWAQAGWRF